MLRLSYAPFHLPLDPAARCVLSEEDVQLGLNYAPGTIKPFVCRGCSRRWKGKDGFLAHLQSGCPSPVARIDRPKVKEVRCSCKRNDISAHLVQCDCCGYYIHQLCVPYTQLPIVYCDRCSVKLFEVTANERTFTRRKSSRRRALSMPPLKRSAHQIELPPLPQSVLPQDYVLPRPCTQLSLTEAFYPRKMTLVVSRHSSWPPIVKSTGHKRIPTPSFLIRHNVSDNSKEEQLGDCKRKCINSGSSSTETEEEYQLKPRNKSKRLKTTYNSTKLYSNDDSKHNLFDADVCWFSSMVSNTIRLSNENDDLSFITTPRPLSSTILMNDCTIQPPYSFLSIPLLPFLSQPPSLSQFSIPNTNTTTATDNIAFFPSPTWTVESHPYDSVNLVTTNQGMLTTPSLFARYTTLQLSPSKSILQTSESNYQNTTENPNIHINSIDNVMDESTMTTTALPITLPLTIDLDKSSLENNRKVYATPSATPTAKFLSATSILPQNTICDIQNSSSSSSSSNNNNNNNNMTFTQQKIQVADISPQRYFSLLSSTY